MFKNKKTVDDHVKKLLSISKDPNDQVKQYNLIAKWYFNVREFDSAKYYLEKYTKYQSNNVASWELKGQVHMELEEYDKALESFESLFRINQNMINADKIVKVLAKMQPNEQKLRYWIEIIDSHSWRRLSSQLKQLLPKNDQITEAEFKQLKSTIKNDSKALENFLTSLSYENCEFNPLKECVDIIDSIPIQEFELIKIVIQIFKNHYSPNKIEYVNYYIVFMLKYLNYRMKISENDYEYSLYQLLKLVLGCKHDYFTRDFIFYLTTFAHYKSNCSNSYVDSLLCGYKASLKEDEYCNILMSNDLKEFVAKNKCVRLSISAHILKQNQYSLKDNWFLGLASIVWKNNTHDDIIEEASRKFQNYVQTNISDSICELDISTLDKQKSDLSLLLFQLYNPHLSFDILINDSIKLISYVAFSFFNNLVLKPNFDKYNMIISKIDITTFLIGSLVSYHKIIQSNQETSGSYLSLPIEMFNESCLGNLSKWWFALYDFVLLKKRQTMIGHLREVLRKGIDYLHLQDSMMSPDVKLCIAYFLEQYAESASENKLAILSHACLFYSDYFTQTKTSITRNIPNLNSRNCALLKLAGSAPTSVFKTNMAFFDCVNIDLWRSKWVYNGYILLLKTELNDIDDERVSIDLLDECIENVEAEIMNTLDLYLYKAKLGLKKIRFTRQKRCPLNKYGDVTTLVCNTKDWAERGMELSQNSGERMSCDEFETILQELERNMNYDVSVLDYTISEKHHTSKLNYNYLSAIVPMSSESDSKMPDPIDQTDTINRNNEMDSHIKDVTNDMSHNHQLIRLLEEQVHRQDKLISNLILKDMEIRSHINRISCLENHCKHLENQNNELSNRLDFVETRNMEMFDKLNRLETFQSNSESCKATEAAINESVNGFEGHFNTRLNEVSKLINSIQKTHINSDTLVNPKTSNEIKSKLVKPRKVVDRLAIDMSKFNANKWQCDVCVAFNNDADTNCLCCSTKRSTKLASDKPVVNQNNKTNPKSIDIDMSRFNAGKWQCLTCVVFNDESLSVCMCCQTPNPSAKVSPSVTSTSKTTIKFGESSLIFNPKPVTGTGFKFGSGSNTMEQKAQMPILFGNQTTNDTSVKIVQSSTKPDVKIKETWKCTECTTENKLSNDRCIACNKSNNLSENNSEADSDVVITRDIYVTEDQKSAARALGLPDHFYHYKNQEGYQSSDDDTEKCPRENIKTEPIMNKTPQIGFNFSVPTNSNFQIPTSNGGDFQQAFQFKPPNVSSQHENGEGDDSNEEPSNDHDPTFEPIVSLDLVEPVNGEEGFNLAFSRRAKLYQLREGEWKERCLGSIRVLSAKESSSQKEGRLVMRQEITERLRCNQQITPEFPKFIENNDDGEQKKSICWINSDYVNGKLENVQLMIRFKEPIDCGSFVKNVKHLQLKQTLPKTE